MFNFYQVAWAPPKSINEDKKLKDFWEVKDGAAFIPWGQMPPDLAPLTAGGEAILDESSVPGALTVKPKPTAQEEVKMDLPELGLLLYVKSRQLIHCSFLLLQQSVE